MVYNDVVIQCHEQLDNDDIIVMLGRVLRVVKCNDIVQQLAPSAASTVSYTQHVIVIVILGDDQSAAGHPAAGQAQHGLRPQGWHLRASTGGGE